MSWCATGSLSLVYFELAVNLMLVVCAIITC